MRRKFSIGAGCQLCRILGVRAHRKNCLSWMGDKNPGAGFYLRKAGKPNLPENAAGKYHQVQSNVALDNGPCLAELAKAASPAQRRLIANAVFPATEAGSRPADRSRQAALSKSSTRWAGLPHRECPRWAGAGHRHR